VTSQEGLSSITVQDSHSVPLCAFGTENIVNVAFKGTSIVACARCLLMVLVVLRVYTAVAVSAAH
jgi:hypothetical protein